VIAADHPGLRLKTASLVRFLRTAQRHVGLAGQVSVLITSDEEMRRLNRQFRGKDKATDVLSFPADGVHGATKVVGDIAISAPIAKRNSAALGHSLELELKVLLLHGLLHLAGYDHEQDGGEMAVMEQSLRAKLDLPSSLIERTAAQVPRSARMDRLSNLRKRAQSPTGRVSKNRHKAHS
jgi:probable rRNA maturation factor